MLIQLVTRLFLRCTDHVQPPCCSSSVYHGPLAFAAACALFSMLCLLLACEGAALVVLSMQVQTVYPAVWLLTLVPAVLVSLCLLAELVFVWACRTSMPGMHRMFLRRGSTAELDIELSEQALHWGEARARV